MSRARRRVRSLSLALALFAAGPVARGGEAPAPESASAALSRVRAELVSPRPEDRGHALAELESRLVRDAAACADVLPSLRDVLRTRPVAERARVARLLLKVPGEDAADAWWGTLDPSRDVDERVFLAAIDAVADRAADPAFARRLLERVRDPKLDPLRRSLVVEAMGGLDGPAAPLVLHAARAGADWVEESCRALALGRRGRADDVGPLIELLGSVDAPPRIHAWESLVRVTRQSLPPAKEPWAAWWDAQHGRLPAAAAPAGADLAVPGDVYAAPSLAHVPTYYGVAVRGRGSTCGVAFCLDVSASMTEHGIEPARKHLVTTLRELTTRTSFDVLAFNENVMPFAGRLVRAHPVMQARAIAWIEAIVPRSFTNIYDTVETAFQYAGAGRRPSVEPQRLDLVFLLSDGAPNRGRYHAPEQVVAGIAALSERRVPIHTIGAGESVLPLLRAISDATGGTFQRTED